VIFGINGSLPRLTHLDAIAGGMVTVGGGQVQQVRAVLGQQGILWPMETRTKMNQNVNENGWT
jgi:hypothetical protein